MPTLSNYKNCVPILFLIILISCKKIIEVNEPKNQITTEKAFETDQSAIAVISNIYAQFNNGSFINDNFTIYLSLYTDELTGLNLSGSALDFYSGSITPENINNLNIWKGFYSIIYQVNAVLEGLKSSRSITSATRRQLEGEAKFLRAFSYFYLINTYNKVPLLTTTDVLITSVAPRISSQEVYEQIIVDLVEAKSLLQFNYPTNEKVRANYWSAGALLARVHLYKSNWIKAEQESSEILDSDVYGPLTEALNVFLKNSREAILQFWTSNGFTSQGTNLNPISGNPIFYLTPRFITEFDTTDRRKETWITLVTLGNNSYPLSTKYKKNSATSGSDDEYLMCLRISEQLLIRAEARAEQNNIVGALEDLNKIRARANTSLILPPITKDSCILLIQSERKKEFFTEWGHRFFDLKRWNKLNEELSSIKPTWTSKSIHLPVPQNEINKNPNLDQNPGY